MPLADPLGLWTADEKEPHPLQIRSETRIRFEVLYDDWPLENSHQQAPIGPDIVPSVPVRIGSVVNSNETGNGR